jgi:hypothetical protein
MNYKERTEAEAFNWEQIAKIAAEHNIHRFETTFDGSGDDGQVDDILAFNKDGEDVEISDIMLNGDRVVSCWSKEEGHHYSTARNESIFLEDMIEELIYTKLYDLHGGWEINEGSYGSVTLYPDGTGKIDYNERIIEVRNEETLF